MSVPVILRIAVVLSVSVILGIAVVLSVSVILGIAVVLRVSVILGYTLVGGGHLLGEGIPLKGRDTIICRGLLTGETEAGGGGGRIVRNKRIE